MESIPHTVACACCLDMAPISALLFGLFNGSIVEHALRVACMGDSITRGDARHEPGNGTHKPFKSRTLTRGNYPLHLQQRLGPGWDVRNFGHGGRSLLDRWGQAYHKTPEYHAALRFKPHVVLLMLGTNDAKVRSAHCRRAGRPAHPISSHSNRSVPQSSRTAPGAAA